MRNRISWILSALITLVLWFTKESIKSWFFDRVVHEINSYTALLIEYAPPTLFAAITIYLLGHGKVWGRKTTHSTKKGESENHFVPIYKGVEYVSERIGDAAETQCYPTTLNALRQQAVNGALRMRGRKQLDTADGTCFSSVHTDIPKEYWEKSVLSYLTVSPEFKNRDSHTNPETAYSWGPKGVHENNRYSSLLIEWNDLLRLWPNKLNEN